MSQTDPKAAKADHQEDPATAALPEEISFDYIKGNFYRVIHTDGAIGGLTPSGHIHMGIWSQRQAYPQHVTYTVNVDGSVGDEIAEKRVSKGIVREIEAGIVMDLEVATRLRDWLSTWIDRSSDLIKEGESE